MTHDILAMEPPKSPFLTEGRCRLAARTLMDLVKIVVAGALASGFFAQFGRPVRIGSGMIALMFFAIAMLLQPPDLGTRKE